MEYTVHQLAELAGVTTRTLRWYDQIGLLPPARTAENGYRYYGPSEVDRLQQILFYRALGVELSQIGRILDAPSFDRMEALKSHLAALEAERSRICGLIETVIRTIQVTERNETMPDQEKFTAFRRRAVEENERSYGEEVRKKYGDAVMDRANDRMLNMTPERYAEWEALGQRIQRGLERVVACGADPSGKEGQEIVQLHQAWLECTMQDYSPQLHRGLAEMYVADDRFTTYYDASCPGCAAFLRAAILHWT